MNPSLQNCRVCSGPEFEEDPSLQRALNCREAKFAEEASLQESGPGSSELSLGSGPDLGIRQATAPELLHYQSQ